MEVEDEPVHGEDAYAEEMSFDDVVGYRGKKDESESGAKPRTSKDSRGLQKKKPKAGSDLVGRGRGSRVSLGDPELDWGSTIGQRPNNRTVSLPTNYSEIAYLGAARSR
jgi:hypothetical protein